MYKSTIKSQTPLYINTTRITIYVREYDLKDNEAWSTNQSSTPWRTESTIAFYSCSLYQSSLKKSSILLSCLLTRCKSHCLPLLCFYKSGQ